MVFIGGPFFDNVYNASKPDVQHKYFSNGYQPSTIDNTDLKRATFNGQNVQVQHTGLKGSVNTAGKNMDTQQVWTDGKNYYIWIGNGGTGGYYANVGSVKAGIESLINNTYGYSATDFKNVNTSFGDNVKNYTSQGTLDFGYWAAQERAKQIITEDTKADTTTNNTTNTATSNGSGTTASKTPAAPQPDYSWMGKLFDDLNKRNDELLKRIEELENPYIPTAEEIAEHYGIDIDEQHILDEVYNKTTNDYWNQMLNYTDQNRTRTVQDALAYERNQLDDYLASYNYQAPTGANRALRAANVMQMNLGGNQTMSALDSNLLDMYNNMQDQYKAELANNPNLAKQHVTSLKTWLANHSAVLNEANTTAYANQLNAYAKMYAAGRGAMNYLNSANSAKYQGLLNAGDTSAKGIADSYTSNAFSRLYDTYLKMNNGNQKLTDNEFYNYLMNSTGSIT